MPDRKTILRVVSALLTIGALAPALAVHATGLVFAEEDRYRAIPLASPPLMGELPVSADLSRYFPTPGDQGEQSSCVGWASSYAVKSYHEYVERGWDLSDSDHVFSPSFIYNQIAYPPGNRFGGCSYIDAFNILTEQGTVPISSFDYDQYDCSRQPSAAVKSSGNPYRIATWRRVNVMDTVEMKAQIASGFPVMLGVMVDNGFEMLGAGETYTYYSGYSTGGHAVVAVGFDDNRGAFKIFNSWGTGWSDNGKGWVSYDALQAMVVEGYVCQDLIVSTPPDVSYVEPDVTEHPETTTVKYVEDYDPTPTQTVYDPDIYVSSDSPYAEVYAADVAFDVYTPDGLGMVVSLAGGIYNCAGGEGQLLLSFTFSDGSPLWANHAAFSDIYGEVAAYTVVFDIPYQNLDVSGTQLYIPYWALNMAQGEYELAVTPHVYVNGFDAGVGDPYYFYYTQY
ncbi:MAG: hypothetical protein A2Y64_07845 [Candidatus Coatesbacteria bacterium RBG_13_66_14]|uniref:Peptidase C1A papain C-terminal domain-containing protein n=1 Tax=Candidatus Coatesbacteria bacterium RBG_13_66_14 TaxID=1817816 RepID=A0A1F5FGI8_9BACT|nr:MAG: hypothetical protein A2Y64_07845 [Candidatus Coatesbacteria bacterium RBG_13_66_14]